MNDKILEKLAKLANKLDDMGLVDEANEIDLMIKSAVSQPNQVQMFQQNYNKIWKQLQSQGVNMSSFTPPLTEDGLMGPKTQAAQKQMPQLQSMLGPKPQAGTPQSLPNKELFPKSEMGKVELPEKTPAKL